MVGVFSGYRAYMNTEHVKLGIKVCFQVCCLSIYDLETRGLWVRTTIVSKLLRTDDLNCQLWRYYSQDVYVWVASAADTRHAIQSQSQLNITFPPEEKSPLARAKGQDSVVWVMVVA